MPNSELHFLTKAVNKTILSANPYVDQLHFLQKDLLTTIKLVNDEKFDLIIDLHNNLRSNIISFFCRVKSIRFNKINVAKWLKVNCKIDVLPKQHIVDRYFKALRTINIKNDNKGLDFFLEADNEFKHFFFNEPYIVIAVGAKHFTKRIPAEKLLHLIKKINHRFVLLGDKNDVIAANIITKQFPVKTLNLCGQINLQQSASVIKKSIAVVTGDTALMHIAAAFNKSIFSVWGNTIPQFGMHPYLIKNDNILPIKNLNIYENNNLNCRPCSKIGYCKCPKNHFECMLNIDYNKLIDDLTMKCS